jgi:hypothetical protein
LIPCDQSASIVGRLDEAYGAVAMRVVAGNR